MACGTPPFPCHFQPIPACCVKKLGLSLADRQQVRTRQRSPLMAPVACFAGVGRSPLHRHSQGKWLGRCFPRDPASEIMACSRSSLMFTRTTLGIPSALQRVGPGELGPFTRQRACPPPIISPFFTECPSSRQAATTHPCRLTLSLHRRVCRSRNVRRRHRPVDRLPTRPACALVHT